MDKAERVLHHLAVWLHGLPIEQQWQAFAAMRATAHWPEMTAAAATSFALIVTAEIGDKSQLVCMALAAKHKALPVLLGAGAAFTVMREKPRRSGRG